MTIGVKYQGMRLIEWFFLEYFEESLDYWIDKIKIYECEIKDSLE
jgi:hypothetical protein